MGWTNWLLDSHIGEVVQIPCLFEEISSTRYQRCQELLGSKRQAQDMARKFGPFLLDESLVRDLRLKGLDLPNDGELALLSPTSWIQLSSAKASTLMDLRNSFELEGKVLLGLVLSKLEKKRFLDFLRKISSVEFSDPWHLVSVYRHFQLPDRESLILAVHTRPRV